MIKSNMEITHKIIIGDSRNMQEIKDESVHLVITSPPYWQLKDYGIKNQIGFNDNYENYINNLNLVWKECYRILHKGCRLCINIGDQFARSIYYGRYKIIPIRTEIIKFCETIGFDYMGAIIWQKVTTTHTTGGASVMGSYPFPRNGILKLNYEFILIFKKLGNSPKVSKEIKNQSKLTKEEWNTYFSGHWQFSGERQDKHLAMFPLELPKRLIKMFSFVDDFIVDPFLGSGTTSLAAYQLNRNSIGYEINKDFLPIIKEKLNINNINIFYNTKFEIKKQKEIKDNYSTKISNLPYIFKDPIKFDKKIDPRKFNFGSRINGNDKVNKNFYSVKNVISPNLILLNNNIKIHLIGIKEDKNKETQAINFIEKKTKGKRVFLKFDSIKYDNENNLLCYLYLENKTFINSHLIKNKLVKVDNSINYKYRDTFLKYMRSNNA